jgi:serine/threonine protein kinase
MKENETLQIFRQLLEAFKILNRHNIMHRDLKPENILFHRHVVKLADFGFCKGMKPDENLTKTMLGSPIYMAPEVLKGDPYTTKADIWSLGVILYECLYGFCPFQSNSIANLISSIDNKPLHLPSKPQVS